jgi:hypothetical protein
MKHRPGEGKSMTTPTANNIECDTIARLIITAISHDEIANCVASSVDNALLAVDHFAQVRGEHSDSTTTNDGTIDAWGWSDETPDGEMAWRCTIRIVPAKVNT